MTFRVIEGGGQPKPPAPDSIEAARAAVIDRVAAAIWAFQDESPDPAYATWEEMKRLAANDPSRAGLVRSTLAQARAAIGAMTTARPPEAECQILINHIGMDPGTASEAMANIDDFVAAVLGDWKPTGDAA